jgi:hypothetical protein
MCCVLCDVYFCVFCFIVLPLPPGKTPFVVKLNNNNNNNKFHITFYKQYLYLFVNMHIHYKVQKNPLCGDHVSLYVRMSL